ncbi:RecQ family ATP-dependent DNA helicase [Alkalicoccus luteus]|uniref:ATP-dependent DNA helicase RecQ n=1 Tax=Alkalicoccus luteus TaxID=1237094 RepID=A0A969PSA8_9BACI|nr:RecQ family ATP-dependent DNA helicase [Alkalicoccus luteus]NJP38159.1 ATP-dependent DNA helicase RecQ [Alkalicoccus luteus]
MNAKELLQGTPFKEFRPGQENVVTSILNGRDTLAVLPTGSGKTLCYQLPAGILPGLTIVVSPLVSLMDDQVTQLKMNGFQKAAALHGNKQPEEKKRIWQQLSQLKLLYVSPEMLAVDKIKQRLQKLTVSLLVVDEAHCISQWGHEFRPDYKSLGEVREELGNPVLLALTATASELVRTDIASSLRLHHPLIEAHSVNRENIFIAIERMNEPTSRQQHLLKLVAASAKPCIIYTGTRRDAEVWSSLYKGPSAFYHGGMNAEDRNSIQGQFLYNEIDVLFATSAFGMGINKPDVRTVVHGYMPASVEQYVQEIGRAGRDGNRAIAHAVVADRDMMLPWHFVEMEIPGTDWMRNVLLPAAEANKDLTQVVEDAAFAEHTASLLISRFNENNREKTGQEIVEALIQQFDKRRQERAEQIRQITTLCNSTSCYRKQILSYFEEVPYSAEENCCSNCHANPHIESLPPRQRSVDNWQELLKNKLHIGAG